MSINALKEKFASFFGNEAGVKVFFSPGRVNLIGEHIDYNGGYVFPGALTIGITGIWRERKDNVIRMRSLNAEGEITVDISGEIAYDEKDHWGNYPKGVLNHLKKEGYKLIGGDILFSSNLPDGAGLSSSAAIEVLTGYMMLSVLGKEDKEIDRVWLSKFSQKVENQYIKVNCGIMDQFSVANGKENQAILLNCETLEFKLVPFVLNNHSLVIMNTNKRRELADSKYNERRAECDKVLEILNKKYNFKNLCDASIEAVNELVQDDVLKKRARHVITENQRVLKSVSVLQKDDLVEFGKLLNASHDSLKNDYEVTGKELDTIVNEARGSEGCLGARMTGAGFGGCAIALVENSKIDNFKNRVKEEYQSKTGLSPEFYVSAIGDGVHRIE